MSAIVRVSERVSTPSRADLLLGALSVRELIGFGWDLDSQVFAPDPAHPLLGYLVCRVEGCGAEACEATGVCTGCLFRWKAARGVDLAVFCAARTRRAYRCQPGLCAVCRVPGFERPATANGLCFICDHQRRRHDQTTAGYVNGDETFAPAEPRVTLGVCTVSTCQRLAARPSTRLCGAHDLAWRTTGCGDLVLFRQTAVPCVGDRGGRVVLAGLDETLINEVLFGIQASVAEGRRLMVQVQVLRPAVALLRRCETRSVADVDLAGRDPVHWFLRFTADRVRLARACPDTEQVGDVWDLRVWGAKGRLSFLGGGICHRNSGGPTRPITQLWLRAAAKAWAAEALIRMTSGPVRAVVGAVGMWSEHLERRPDSGTDPSVLSHRDIEAFLARLGHLQQAGSLSAGARDRTIHTVAKFLRDCREMGLTQPGRELAALPDDVVIRAVERPATTRRDDEVGKALPDTVIAQLLAPASLALLDDLAGPTLIAAVELGVGVGRRTAELCSLAFDCLDYDDHGDAEHQRSPVLVHDMPKVDKTGCRLPIHEREALIIRAQQARVTARFPTTPPRLLVLFPRPLTNPDGTHPLSTAQFQRVIRAWINALPRLDAPERDSTGRPVPFPRDGITPYSFRHTFAQRHADAGTPVDTLKELLGHDTVRTTLGYYRVTAKRKREAQNRLGPLQLNRAGQLVRPGLDGLAEAERWRDDVGQVAVPFGICTEPANVAAGGHSCPFRHRCSGCEYFRTDASFQPELRAYLAQLLADRERLTTAVPALAEWARRDSTPSDDEIDAVRRLVRANDQTLDGLDENDRDAIDEAITVIRKHRATLDVTFSVEMRGLVRQPAPRLFPTIEAESAQNGTNG